MELYGKGHGNSCEQSDLPGYRWLGMASTFSIRGMKRMMTAHHTRRQFWSPSGAVIAVPLLRLCRLISYMFRALLRLSWSWSHMDAPLGE